MKEGGKTTSAGARNRLRGLLATSEVALALVLLVGAGLMMKSLYRLLAVDSGFRSEHVLKLEMDLRTAQYDKDPAVIAFWQQTLDRVRALPGVESAAVGTAIPLTDNHSPHRHYGGRDALAQAGQFPASRHPHRQPGL